MATRWNHQLDAQLTRLLGGGDAGLTSGAELQVRHPHGQLAFLAPLARHHRVEHHQLLWVRPIVGGYTPDPRAPGDPLYVYDLAIARRRALAFTSVASNGVELQFELHDGQRARIRPARPQLLAELQRWDTWYYLHLSAEQQHELDALHYDSG